jgi:hypothetical protein
MQRETMELNTYYRPGVFRYDVHGVTVGYFVGWRHRYGSGARNIREGQYFRTVEDAIAWRDAMERNRNGGMFREIEQIA